MLSASRGRESRGAIMESIDMMSMDEEGGLKPDGAAKGRVWCENVLHVYGALERAERGTESVLGCRCGPSMVLHVSFAVSRFAHSLFV